MGVTLAIFNLVGNMPDFNDWLTIIVIALEISLLIGLSNSELRPSWPELRDDFNSFIIFLVISSLISWNSKLLNTNSTQILHKIYTNSNNLCNFGHVVNLVKNCRQAGGK